ncbi:MAG: phosphoribosylanthranilate isomerase [Lachnospiraceae bacterium]|nr:phosphoribosylanthranilate isomerase [Lachnospiraceae bacterium]
MTKIKLCGLTRPCDIAYANALLPEYIGFVFAPASKRCLSAQAAKQLRKELRPEIIPVGVFVDEEPDAVIDLLKKGIIKAVQLHGKEDDDYIRSLRAASDCTIIKAFRIKTKEDIEAANRSPADFVLLDSGGGTGSAFDWSLIRHIRRDYFLAGGLTPENVAAAVSEFAPFAVDASSSLETDGFKDQNKMTAFVSAVRNRKDELL